MELKLNVYDRNKIEKTYVTDTCKIMFGTIEDLTDIIDVDKLDDNKEVVKAVFKGFKLIKPLLKDIFIGLTDDELRRTDTKELIALFTEIIKFSFDEFLGVSNGKN